MTSLRRPDRRSVIALSLVAIVGLGVLLVAAPARFMTEDDAKYLGIGVNLFAGHGPTTVFGEFFPHHAPLWPAIVVLPHVLFGIDPVGWAHLAAIASGCAIVALTAWFGWRIVPLAAALGSAAVVAFPYFLNLGRGLGLDLPAAALALGYVAVGLTAVRRGSIRWAIAAGALFAVAFLVKEIALPFAPVPFLAGLVRGVTIRTIARLAGAVLLVGAIGTSWWFVVYARETGAVYRLGTPAWTLAPIGLAIAIVGIVLLVAGRRGRPTAADDPGPGTSGAILVRLGWGGAFLWSIALTLFFARSPAVATGGFLAPAQIRYYLDAWLPDLGPFLAFGLVGAVIATVERIRATRAPDPTAADFGWSAVDDLIVATLCGLPLVLLVVSVGEIPRHYIAQLAILAALGSAGWLRIAGRLFRRPDRTTMIVAGLGFLAAGALLAPGSLERGSLRSVAALAMVGTVIAIAVFLVRRVRTRGSVGSRLPVAERWAPIGVGLAFVVGALLVAASNLGRPSSAIEVVDAAKASAVRSASDWVRANIPRGSTVAFGGGVLSYETAIRLQGDYPIVRFPEYQDARPDPAASLGVGRKGEPAHDDWVALSAAPRVVSTLYGYRAAPLESRIRDLGVRVWIQNTLNVPDNPTTIGEALRRASGTQAVAQQSWPYSPGSLDTTVFAIDPERLQFTDRLVVGVDALEEIVKALERDASHGPATAATLLKRVVAWPDGDPSRALLDRLRTLGGPQ